MTVEISVEFLHGAHDVISDRKVLSFQWSVFGYHWCLRTFEESMENKIPPQDQSQHGCYIYVIRLHNRPHSPNFDSCPHGLLRPLSTILECGESRRLATAPLLQNSVYNTPSLQHLQCICLVLDLNVAALSCHFYRKKIFCDLALINATICTI